MVELDPERTGVNFNTPLAFRKKDQAGIAGRDLTAAVQSRAEEHPSAG